MRRAPLRVVAVAVLAVSLAVSALTLALMARRTGGFALRRVVVEGVDSGREEAVRTVTDAFLGRSLVTLDTGLVRRKLREFPWVKEVRVRREFPVSLRLVFTVRRSVALLHTPTEVGPRLFAVDAEGVLIDEARGTPFPEGPVVTGLEVRNPFLGRRVEMRELAELLAALERLRTRDAAMYAALQEVAMEGGSGQVRYRLLLTDRNLPVRTERLDDAFFEGLRILFRHYGSVERLRRVVATEELFFVEERS